MTETKHCSLCAGDFPATSEYFHTGGHGRELGSYCKSCARKKANTWHQENRDRHLAYIAEYKLAHPEYFRNYRRNIEKKRQYDRTYYHENKERLKDKNKKYYHANKSSAIERAKRWALLNPEKTSAYSRIKSCRRRAVPPDTEGAAYIKILMRDPCAYCGSREKTVIDHIVPVSKGGLTTVDNLTSSCRPCNAAKTNKTLLTFLLELR